MSEKPTLKIGYYIKQITAMEEQLMRLKGKDTSVILTQVLEIKASSIAFSEEILRKLCQKDEDYKEARERVRVRHNDEMEKLMNLLFEKP